MYSDYEYSPVEVEEYRPIFPSQNSIFEVGINKVPNGFTLNSSAVPDTI
jgi:hypothetical protein